MKASVAGIALALIAALLFTAAPTAADVDSTSFVSGTIERIIVEPATHEDDHSDHVHEDFESEQVYLVGDDRTRVRIPLDLAGDLETGTRARVQATSSPDGDVATSIVDVSYRPTRRSEGVPQRTTQHLPYAVVEVSAPDIVSGGATASDARYWVQSAQAFYDEEAPGAFTFSIQSEHRITWDSNVCRNATDVYDAALERFAIPEDVGVIMLMRFDRSCGFPAGVASLSAGRPGGWMFINTSSSRWAGLFIHELGHNLGLRHATRWRCESGSSPLSPDAAGCLKQEYGVRLNTMGGGVVANGSGAIDAHQRWQLGVYADSALWSTSAPSGSALLLDHELPVSAVDNGTPVFFGGERIARALHLRDSRGEAWVVLRKPVPPLDRTPAITVAYRADWGRSGHPEPMQLDTVPGDAAAEDKSWYTLSAFDLVYAGGSVRTPGGAEINVAGMVDAGAYGTAMRVSWTGNATESVPPGAPGIIATASGEEAAEGWIAATGSSAVLRQTPPQAMECEIIDGDGKSLARWGATSIVPVPGPEWRGAQDAALRYTAWAPDQGKRMLATWRLPLMAGAPVDGLSAPLEVAGGGITVRTRCTDFADNTTQSPTVSLRVDSTPPRVADGALTILGLTRGTVQVTSGIRSARPYLLLSMPSFVDTESGLGKRVEACAYLAPEKATSCYSTVSVGAGTVRSAAVDAVGNRSATQEVPYRLVPIRTVTKSSASWVPTEQGHRPAAPGASTAVNVRGREMGVVTLCGSGLGTMRVDVNGKKGVPFDVESNYDPFYCLVGITKLSKRVNKVTITYLESGTTEHELVGVVARK